jgi:ABC-type transport system involved in resistance to organic solvents, periplasmic component
MSKEFRLGVFIVGTLLALAAGVFLIGGKQMLFSTTYTVKAEFANVAGLDNAAEVRVGGIRQGTVKRINLPHRPDGKVTVVMSLDSKTHDIVKKDSVAAIKSEGLLGDKYVEVSFGSDEGAALKDGDTIPTQPPLDFSDLIQKTDQILDSTKETIQNVDTISAKINRGEGTIGALINDKKVYQQVNAATAEAKSATTKLDENMEAMKHNFLLRGFYKKRGYEDETELKKHEISGLPRETAIKTFDYDAKQLFDKPDTAKLKNQKLLNEAGKFLEENKFGTAVVSAYMSMKGDSEKDRVLTEARSMVVRDYLIKNFKLDDTRIKTLGMGKSNVAADNGKVAILVYGGGANPPAKSQSSGTGTPQSR